MEPQGAHPRHRRARVRWTRWIPAGADATVGAPGRLAERLVAASAAIVLGIATLPVAARSETPPVSKPATPAALPELKTRLDLKEPFNLARGKVRILTFFSPTCMHCIANAQSLQKQVLDRLETPDIEVFAVWLKVLEEDSPETAQRATTVLTDPRVHHYWDPNRVLNAQILDAIVFDVQVRIYDIVLLYDREATWDKRLPRPPYWMHEFRGAPGPTWDAAVFGTQVVKALDGEALDIPNQR